MPLSAFIIGSALIAVDFSARFESVGAFALSVCESIAFAFGGFDLAEGVGFGVFVFDVGFHPCTHFGVLLCSQTSDRFLKLGFYGKHSSVHVVAMISWRESFALLLFFFHLDFGVARQKASNSWCLG